MRRKRSLVTTDAVPQWYIGDHESFNKIWVYAFQFSSVQDGICALEKAHMLSNPSLRGFPIVAFETVPVFV